MNPPPLYVEISHSSFKAVRENAGLELPLERLPDGRLTGSCKEQVAAALKKFLQAKSWQPRPKAWCAIGVRGVSLRRLLLPAGTREEFNQRLLLQIEGEFPLSPEELAWGSQPLGGAGKSNGVMAKQELLVAAVKKNVVADYQEILSAGGTNPVFTLAALARCALCPEPAGTCAMLDIGSHQSELTCLEKGVPTTSRIIFLGSDNFKDGTGMELEALARTLQGGLTGSRLFITGDTISGDFTGLLAKLLGVGWQCSRLEAAVGEGRSAAIAGLKTFAGPPPLVLSVKQTGGGMNPLATPDVKKWVARAVALAAVLLLLPYAEALLLKPHLAKKVSSFRTDSARLAVIDREMDFLQYLKQNQPPYLDALFLLAKSVPPGTRIDALTMNSHGEVSLRGSFRDGQQVGDFRTRLIGSGLFAGVSVEEQAPTPDRQKVNVRISAQWKTPGQLQSLAIGPTAEEISKVGNKREASPGQMPPGLLTAAPMPAPPARKETK